MCFFCIAVFARKNFIKKSELKEHRINQKPLVFQQNVILYFRFRIKGIIIIRLKNSCLCEKKKIILA